jgi:hypothetical protein
LKEVSKASEDYHVDPAIQSMQDIHRGQRIEEVRMIFAIRSIGKFDLCVNEVHRLRRTGFEIFRLFPQLKSPITMFFAQTDTFIVGIWIIEVQNLSASDHHLYLMGLHKYDFPLSPPP